MDLPVTPLPVSVCVLAHNEESQIAECLNSVLGQAGQVVVVDAESTDATARIVKRIQEKYQEVGLHSAPNQANFDLNKMLAFERASQPWIFYLDADERMTPELWKEIAGVVGDTGYAGYRVGRKNYYFGRWLRYGGMYPERQPRLFRAGTGHFPGNGLHESLVIKGEVGELKEPFIHYAYTGVSQFMGKLDRYTSVQADGWRQKGISWSLANHLRYGLARPLARFVQKYVVLQGFRDGFIGFFAAWMSGVSEFIAYAKVAPNAGK